MAIAQTRDALSRIFYQRCFWLFAVLVLLIGAVLRDARRDTRPPPD